MKKYNTREIVIYSILMALTVVVTMYIQIPAIVLHGYINLGDMVLLFAALVLGKRAGFFIGGFGSALADLLTGYAVYAPVTLIVKGLEGFICGLIFEKIGKKKAILATVPAGIFMAFGYFAGEFFIYGFGGALPSVLGNLLQGIVGAVIAFGLEKSIGYKKILGIKI